MVQPDGRLDKARRAPSIGIQTLSEAAGGDGRGPLRQGRPRAALVGPSFINSNRVRRSCARDAFAASPAHAWAPPRRPTSLRRRPASTVRAAPENRAARAATKSRVRSNGRPSTTARAQSPNAARDWSGMAPSACSASITADTLWSFGRRLAAGTAVSHRRRSPVYHCARRRPPPAPTARRPAGPFQSPARASRSHVKVSAQILSRCPVSLDEVRCRPRPRGSPYQKLAPVAASTSLEKVLGPPR